MKKIILSGLVVAAIALVAFNFYNKASKEALSDLANANIEALAENEVPPTELEPLNPGTKSCDWGQLTYDGSWLVYCGTCNRAWMWPRGTGGCRILDKPIFF
jgi:hypothetical protein